MAAITPFLAALAALLALAAPAAAEDAWSAGRLWVAADDLPDADAGSLAGRAARNRVNAGKLGLALAGAGLLLWETAARRRGRERRGRRGRDALLALLGGAGFLGFWNFGLFHYPDFAHAHEVVHYVLGAKYQPELGYTRLYRCIAVADASAGLGARVAARSVTDLETYELVPAKPLLADPQRCVSHFTRARWDAFRADVGWLRERIPAETWEAIQRDHGYNPTPVWAVLGRALVGRGALDETRLSWLLMLDPLLALAMAGVAAWGFGWRATCVALLFWGTNHPAEYGWIGGSYLRGDWLAASVAGFALLRRGRPGAAGFLLGTAALLRVFPALFLGAVALRALAAAAVERKPPSPAQLRLGVGALAAALLLGPLSLWSSGAAAWPEFADNIAHHAATPATNAVGLSTLVAFDPASRERHLAEAEGDPSRRWKQARRERREARWPLFVALAGAFTLGIGLAARRSPDWVAAILGVGLVPVLLEPASYYTGVLLAYGFLAARSPGIGAALLLLDVAGWLAAARWVHWDDVFAATSAATLIFVAVATGLAARSFAAADAPATAERSRPGPDPRPAPPGSRPDRRG